VVILGAGGFVASATHRRLDELAVPVLALPRAALDLTDRASVARLVELLRPEDTLLFVAANAPVKNEAMLLTNLRMGAAVCDALQRVPVRHVVYISSDAVYADSQKPLTERSCAQPGSLHGVMHLAREVMLANAYGGALCFVRPTLIYGPADPHNGYGPNRFMRLAALGEDIILFGEGEERRDHVWIDDVTRVVTRVVLQGSSGVINVAVGEVVSFSDVAKLATRLMGTGTQVRSSPRVGPMPHNGLRPFDVSGLLEAFPDFRCVEVPEGLEKVRDAYRSSR
jgi:nucleoside-diphosphate-sugar epimerase